MKEKFVRRAFLPSDIAVLAAIAAVGVLCILLGWSGVGVIVLLCAAFMLPFYRHGYRITGRKGFYRLQEILVSKECKDVLLSYLEGGRDVLSYKPRVPGGALVEIFYKKGSTEHLARYYDHEEHLNGVEREPVALPDDKYECLQALAGK